MKTSENSGNSESYASQGFCDPNRQMVPLLLEGHVQKKIRVRLDDGKRVTLNLRQYQDLKLGYALTTHKAQGATVDHSYVLVGGRMQGRELSYVQTSRARHSTRLYTDSGTAGENLKQLSKTMAKSQRKSMAHQLLEKARLHRFLDRAKRLSPARRQGQKQVQGQTQRQPGQTQQQPAQKQSQRQQLEQRLRVR